MKKGLTSEEAKKQIEKYGLNELQEGEKKSLFKVILSQIINPLVLLLIIATIISFVTGEIIDAIIILAVVVINTVIGAVQELKAEKALEELKKMSSPMAVVIRDGKEQEIPASKVTIGDYVILEAGRVVPADIKLIETSSLKINESALTGESLPVEKDHTINTTSDTPIGDRKDHCFMSTLVTYGRGEGTVVGVAENTEIGKIAKMLKNIEDKETPLQANLNKISSVLGIVGVILCILMFVFSYFINAQPFLESLMLAISFAVAVIPEGLAAVVTIVLALGIKEMVKVNAIVKQLQAVETLGAVNVICSDKTGTLTQNKMTVMESFFNNTHFENDKIEKDNLLMKAFVLCNDAKLTENGPHIGDPTETALLEYAVKNGYDISEVQTKYKRIDEIPFDSDRKMMTTMHLFNNEKYSFTKGAMESILPLTKDIYLDGKIIPLTEDLKTNVIKTSEAMAQKALRVLVVAMRKNDETPQEKDFTFIGFVGMIDPPKEGVKETIQQAHNAGINVVMITGDHKTTAFAIAKQLDICQDEKACLSGAELDTMDESEFNKNILNYNVFARVSPEHKVKIVNAFQNKGKIVSMTGDGVNDAPSLKIADIGVSMGKGGTDVAKGAADVILVDDNFITIVGAVKEGRNLFNNIKKSVSFLLRANFSEVVMMCTAIFTGFASPLTTIQILWLNLITDTFPGLALGMDTKTDEVMNEQPRDINTGILSKKDYSSILFNGAFCGLAALIAFILPAIFAGTPIEFNALKTTVAGELLPLCRTFAFTTLVLSELFMAYVLKCGNKSLFKTKIFDNKLLNYSVIFGAILQILFVSIPALANILGLVSLSLINWLIIIACAFIPVLASQIKFFLKK